MNIEPESFEERSEGEAAAEAAQRTRGPRPSERTATGGVQSVERAVLLLELLAASGSGCSLTELAARAKLNISTCHHLLATLTRNGYVAQVPGRRTYALGARVLHLSQAFMQQVDLPRRAQPVIDRLSDVTGEAVHFAVLQGEQVVTVAKTDGRHAVRVETSAIGSAGAPHASAAGKAMLAWLPEDQATRVLEAGGMERFTTQTVTDRHVLVEEMRHVRRNGFAMDREEYQPGVVCIGAAVRDQAGAVIGSLSASSPVFRADEAHLEKIRAAVMAAARELSSALGAPAQSVPSDQPD